MSPILPISNSQEDDAPVPALPTDLWREVAKRMSTEEWVRTCGSVCRTFYDIQPRHINVRVESGEKCHATLCWIARHWEEAVTLDLHFQYFGVYKAGTAVQDVNFFGDLSQTLEESRRAVAAQSVTVSVNPQLPIVPKAVEFPSVLRALKLTGHAVLIEGVSWLTPKRVVLLFKHIKGEGFKKLQTLHTSGDLEVEEHAFRNQSGAITRGLFSAKRIVKKQMSPTNPL
ncbi:hypothetical protein COCOBI_01-0520 [Coccomyxa sp. Obi]|nr:hypothetical protein COCOBI_01-0520 [Coccomyxa sp. Obi]